MARRASPDLSRGLLWYRPQDYLLARAIMLDAHQLPPAYDAWSEEAREEERALINAGRHVIRVYCYPDLFVLWCQARGLVPCEASRRLYAADPTNWSANDRR